jgi:hypothetical protein
MHTSLQRGCVGEALQPLRKHTQTQVAPLLAIPAAAAAMAAATALLLLLLLVLVL